MPINVIRGLPFVQMEPNTAEEFDTLPHVVLTQGGEWDPAVLDYMLTDNDDWANQVKREGDPIYESPIDLRGEHKNKEPPKTGNTLESPAGRPNEDPDDVEVNLHKIDTVTEIHEAHHQATNLNKIMSLREKECQMMSQKNMPMF